MSKASIWIINGPNLNLLGSREQDIYGKVSFEEYLETLKALFPQFSIDYYQSNVEGELINKLHDTGFSAYGIIINPGGYSHTSVSLADAIVSITNPVIEVHISNIYARDAFRHLSLTGRNCKGVITGLGLEGYLLALRYFEQQHSKKP